MWSHWLAVLCLTFWTVRADVAVQPEAAEFTIEGRLELPRNQENFTNIIEDTQILVDGGAYIGFIKEDFSFEIKNVAPGSYLVQVTHPSAEFESVRVDISSKGAKRARKAINIQPSLNQQLPYPLRVRPIGAFGYFQQRETWRMSDFLMNPMVLTMVLPVILLMVLPKLMTEEMQQTQREVQQTAARMPEMPELSEVMTSFLGGQSGSKSIAGSAGSKKAKRSKDD